MDMLAPEGGASMVLLQPQVKGLGIVGQ